MDEILNLIGSVSEGFPSYFCKEVQYMGVAATLCMWPVRFNKRMFPGKVFYRFLLYLGMTAMLVMRSKRLNKV